MREQDKREFLINEIHKKLQDISDYFNKRFPVGSLIKYCYKDHSTDVFTEYAIVVKEAVVDKPDYFDLESYENEAESFAYVHRIRYNGTLETYPHHIDLRRMKFIESATEVDVYNYLKKASERRIAGHKEQIKLSKKNLVNEMKNKSSLKSTISKTLSTINRDKNI